MINSLLDGILFSDGTIECRYTNPRLSITQKASNKEYLDWIRENTDFDWRQHKYSYLDNRTNKRYSTTSIRTKALPELLQEYKRWYPNGNKVIPRDLEITPDFLLHTYLGDGCLVHPKRGRPRIVIATNGFPIEDVEWFVERMNDLGFSCVRDGYNNSTRFHTCATEKFLHFVGDCPVECFQYKWC